MCILQTFYDSGHHLICMIKKKTHSHAFCFIDMGYYCPSFVNNLNCDLYGGSKSLCLADLNKILYCLVLLPAWSENGLFNIEPSLGTCLKPERQLFSYEL